jgi:G3E family GTPase
MIPIALITGFLGSGKSTLLRNIARQHPDRRLAFLINEFSAVDVDGRVLESDAGPVLALPGGSIFCTCLVSEFIRTLEDLPGFFGTEEAPIEGVVVEASGIASPKVAAKMLHETHLDQTYELTTVVAMVDPGTFPVLLETLPNIVEQIQCCDVAIINKIDLFDAETVARCAAEIQRIHPGARIVETSYGKAVPELFGAATVSRALDGDYAACIDPNYARASVRFREEVDLDRLLNALEACQEKLYRAKGFVPAQGKIWHVDLSGGKINVSPVSSPKGPCDLVFIGPGAQAQEIHGFAARLRDGELKA